MMAVKRLYEWGVTAISMLVGLVVIFPLIYCIGVSLMSPSDLGSYPPRLFPSALFLDNYKTVFSSTPIFTFMWNSFLIAVVGTIGRLVTSSLAAYAFAFMEFRWKKGWFLLILGTMMIPGDMLIITNYITVAQMGLINTYGGVMIVMLVAAVFMFMLRQHFMTVPRDYRDAAFVDGCGDLRFFAQILLPMSVPVLSSITITSFIGLWNTYLWPLLVTNSEQMRTVQVGITMLQFPEGMVYGPIMAGVTVILIPSVLVFVFFQKQLVFGVTSGGLKG
ncbi:carbohydrate ABC transporter permease [Paenibacillus elgii]|uniref:Carbohydrate ABC transporter permease n=1 Tax=Paenibacillus elgii TaxID=189691 RepID=A0A2T6FRR8_9BACL|nr:carbohydrate ABC transporter permease [Paenibacillus elgii]PUA34566.1 carbohydrate ABC transporter permease [Paenibacillus elgii]